MIAVVAVIGALAYWDERRRAEADLDDFAVQQASVADAAAVALAAGARDALRVLDDPDRRVVLVPPGEGPRGLDDRALVVPELAAAAEHDVRTLRIERDDAPAFGLPRRTAMVGLARVAAGPQRGWTVAIAANAAHSRDRGRTGLTRLVLAIALAAGLVGAFGGLALARQRAQHVLERELAIAQTARARDEELERLARAATMAAVGSGVAHELSTPLGVIVGRAEQLAARAGGDERVAKAAQAILEQVDHVDRVVRGLLGLARGAPIALEPCAPDKLVREAAALVEHRFVRAGVRLELAAAAAPEIRCEPLLFKHALVNLLLNACDASPAGSTVRLEVRADGSELAFVVTDEGEGITPDAAARATEPFFTTKPVGQGTGLGLAIAREIASSHRGTLAIAPRPTHGTRASITVPVEGGAHA
ncbi:MAG TPA: HAMP domain-containing sensor histidine kinase [Kofleriaceae bacterium]